MKTTRKILAVLLVIFMGISLTACGNNATTEPAAPTDNPASAGAAGENEAPDSEVDRANEFVTIATGPTSGIYFPIGGAFAETLKAAGYQTSAQATGASAENIDLILKGQAELAIAMQDSVVQAYEGFGAYEEKGANDNLRALMRLWPNYVQLITIENSGITSVEDLKGKKVGVGAANSGVELNARMIYEAYGMTYEDSTVDYLSYGEAIDQMKNGQCDAAFVTSGLPNGTVTELATSYEMVIVPIDGEGRDNLIEKYPFFSSAIIPANTYNNTEDVESVFVYNIMLVSNELEEDVVYDMMECIFADIDTIKASHNAADKNIDITFGVEDLKIPLHDGAAKFWQNQGYTTPFN